MIEEPLLLSSLLPPENVVVPLSASTKEEAVEELLDLLVAYGIVTDKQEMLRLIWERENVMSTGIGYGVAIPHTISNKVTQPAASLGLKPSGIDYNSLDGKPATILFLLISPELDASPHVKILAHFSRVFRHAAVREKLLACTSGEEASAVIREAEAQYGQGEQ
jgi:fructose-specific phosphotransferase system IIA component